MNLFNIKFTTDVSKNGHKKRHTRTLTYCKYSTINYGVYLQAIRTDETKKARSVRNQEKSSAFVFVRNKGQRRKNLIYRFVSRTTT